MPSATLMEYIDEMTGCTKMMYPNLDASFVNDALKYSIKKRYKSFTVSINNNYSRESCSKTLLELCDYINDKKPIMTSYGVLFQRHGTVPNPLKQIIDDFLNARSKHKKQMFQYPKHSEMFEYYNLLQGLDKVDVNGLYGTLGMYKALIYNRNVATSITSMGRTYISTAGLFFEQFLADNVKFNSLEEVIIFIKNTCSERNKRKYKDENILSRYISREELFSKLILDCGLFLNGKISWLPDNKDMNIIWNMICGLDQEDINRIYYKNNLYDFLDNDSMRKSIRYMMSILQTPFLSPSEIPEELVAPLQEFTDILEEYVMNHFPVMDRVLRWKNMIKDVCIISDTDSAFVNLDAFVRYATGVIADMDLNIMHQRHMINPFEEVTLDDEDRYKVDPFEIIEPDYDYDFYKDDVIELKRSVDPLIVIPQDNVRYSLINIMSYVVSELCNKYIEDSVKLGNADEEGVPCRMYLKNEFLLKRLLLTYVKKNYASIQELQEGNIIENNIDSALDVKGIPCMTKSVTNPNTRKELKKILYNDILNTDKIDQIKVIKDLAIFEKKIMKSLYSGSKDYYKPATVKSMNAYADPMRINGVRAIIVWNALRREEDTALDPNERNAINIASIKLNPKVLEKMKDKDPILYEKGIELLKDDLWKNKIDSIAIPLEQEVPEWLMEILDYDKIISDNLSGFPLESIGITPSTSNINYINVVKL